jgi:hypothetical protein
MQVVSAKHNGKADYTARHFNGANSQCPGRPFVKDNARGGGRLDGEDAPPGEVAEHQPQGCIDDKNYRPGKFEFPSYAEDIAEKKEVTDYHREEQG